MAEHVACTRETRNSNFQAENMKRPIGNLRIYLRDKGVGRWGLDSSDSG
jgi:hypothetical protein